MDVLLLKAWAPHAINLGLIGVYPAELFFAVFMVLAIFTLHTVVEYVREY
jgi:hypothetical protein